MSKEKISKISHHVICALPLAGVAVTNLLPISTRGHQFLVLITLLWLQVFMLFEVFSSGKYE